MKITKRLQLLTLLLIIFSSVIIGTILGRLFGQSNKESNCYRNTCIDFSVSRCQQDLLYDTKINIIGRTVTFHHNLSSYCRPSLLDPNNFWMELSLDGNTFIVKEILNASSGITYCVCGFGINGTISGLPSGSYYLNFSFEIRNFSQFPIQILKSFQLHII